MVSPAGRGARPATRKTRKEAAAWFARLRGPPAAGDQAAFDQWRQERPDRQAAYDRLLRHWEGAAVLQASTRDFHLGQRRAAGLWSAGQTRWLVTPLGTAVVIMAAIYVAPARPNWLDVHPIPSMWTERLATPVGAIRTVALPDGSTITLDTGTVVRWRFSGQFRRLALLRGRARFIVAHDAARPFVVAAGDGQVTAHGTVFDVALAAPHQVVVSLYQGVVDVDDAASGRAARETTLTPGQAMAFGRGRAPTRPRSIQPGASAWPTGMLTFENTPLAEALAEANRYSIVPIRLAGEDLGALRLTGAFRAGAPRSLADSLAATFDLRVDTEPGGALVLTRPAASSGP